MEQARLWKRMGDWFKRAGQPPVTNLPPVGRDGLLQGVEPDGAEERGAASGALRLSKQQAREQALEKLQDGHLKVVSLMESLQKHMEAQDRRGEVIAGSLEGIAGSMSHLSEAAGRQTETVTDIAAQLRTGNERARRWEEAFAEFPALAEAQRATLATLGEQMAAGRETDERIGESLGVVHGALGALDRSTTTSTDVLRSLQESSVRNQELVGELIRKQRTWLARLVVVTLVVALAAVALAVIALVR